MDSVRTSPVPSLVQGSARATVFFPNTEKPNMSKSSKNQKRKRRRSDGERAPLATLSPESLLRTEGRRGRRRGKRGGARKRRAGKRKNQRKTDRLKMKNVCIGYWNCRSSRKRGRELEKLAYDFDLFFLQETNAKTLSCPGYTSYINPVSPTHHGLATLVRNDIQHRVRDVSAWDREDRELQALEITIRNRSWVIVNLYAGGGKLVKEDDWEFLHELCGLGDVVMIVGDFAS